MIAEPLAGDNWVAIPARRENVGLVIGIAGPTGSGKTVSAMRVAIGLTGGGQQPVIIDTENGRAKFQADYGFDWVELKAPFTPARYAGIISAQWTAGYRTVVVDQISHEYEGEGGLQDWHDRIMEEMIGQARKKSERADEMRLRETYAWPAWREPKLHHKRDLMSLLRAVPANHHLVLCFRAEQKTAMVERTNDHGQKYRTVETRQGPTGRDGWFPICERDLPYEMILSFLVLPTAPGVPLPIKAIPEPLQPFVPLDRPLSEETGRQLAAWARGAAPAAETRAPAAQEAPTSPAGPSANGGGSADGVLVLEEIKVELLRRVPGNTPPERRAKSELLARAFGTGAWVAVANLEEALLRDGLRRLRALPGAGKR